eukprot:366260-Chlamydomonas_euryale.AAC.47
MFTRPGSRTGRCVPPVQHACAACCLCCAYVQAFPSMHTLGTHGPTPTFAHPARGPWPSSAESSSTLGSVHGWGRAQRSREGTPREVRGST